MPIDPNITGTLISTWGAPGALMLLMLGAIVYLFMNLLASYKDRHEESKNMITEMLKDSASNAEVLKDLKSSIDAMSKTMEATIAVLRAQQQVKSQ